jgi:hypothetical protein
MKAVRHGERWRVAIAFRTGLLTGALAVLLTFTPAAKVYRTVMAMP